MVARRGLFVLVLGWQFACGDDDVAPRAWPPAGEFPSVDELLEQPELPDIFTSFDGARRAESPDDLRTWRRDELLSAFSHYVYGSSPEPSFPVTAESVTRIDDLFGGAATYEELAVIVAPSPAPPLRVGIFLPKSAPRPAVFLGLNKCGNHSLIADPRIPISTSFALRACSEGPAPVRGAQESLWPVEAVLARGFGLVTFHESDAAPDDADRPLEGVRAGLSAPGEPRVQWGTIAVWSWALSRVVDVLQTRQDLDGTRVAVVGHSRRGKAALWAAASDPRIALAVAHQSGTGGSALARSPVGESFRAINTLFPHWFNDVFPTFNDNERKLPIDQHQLLALIAPRPLLLVDGDTDEWADPPGSRAAAEAASAAWKLYGDAGIVEDASGLPMRDATLVWTSRPGGHGIDASDWEIFTTFAARHLRAAP